MHIIAYTYIHIQIHIHIYMIIYACICTFICDYLCIFKHHHVSTGHEDHDCSGVFQAIVLSAVEGICAYSTMVPQTSAIGLE